VALERGAHPFFIAKTAAAGDAVDALLGFFQQAPGGFQPEHFDAWPLHVDHIPFRGDKQSGIGTELGHPGLEEDAHPAAFATAGQAEPGPRRRVVQILSNDGW
jgi:hypothetical protein